MLKADPHFHLFWIELHEGRKFSVVLMLPVDIPLLVLQKKNRFQSFELELEEKRGRFHPLFPDRIELKDCFIGNTDMLC